MYAHIRGRGARRYSVSDGLVCVHVYVCGGCRTLLFKYFVPEEESRIGRKLNRIVKALEDVMAHYSSTSAEEESLDEDEALLAEKAAEVDALFSQLGPPRSIEEEGEEEEGGHVFGSWSVAHPAAASVTSQEGHFTSGSGQHPASFSVGVGREEEGGGVGSPRSLRRSRMQTTSIAVPNGPPGARATGPPKPEPKWRSQASEQGWVIVKSLQDLAALAGTKKDGENDLKVGQKWGGGGRDA